MTKSKFRKEIPIAVGASFFAGLIASSLPENTRIAAGAAVLGGLIVAASL